MVSGQQHPLPKNTERVLPNFDRKWGDTTYNHIHPFFLALHRLGVANEDVMCLLFSFTFIGATSTWYFSLRIGSITSRDAFQQAFLDKFGDDKTPIALVLELSHLKMESKERVKDFNIQFNTLFKRIPATTRHTEGVIMEFYISALPIPTAMWVKRNNVQILQGPIDEEVKVENEMLSVIACHRTTGEMKAS